MFDQFECQNPYQAFYRFHLKLNNRNPLNLKSHFLNDHLYDLGFQQLFLDLFAADLTVFPSPLHQLNMLTLLCLIFLKVDLQPLTLV